MTGTLLNIATVLLGGGLGVLLGARLPERMRETVMHGLGLVTLILGIDGTSKYVTKGGSVTKTVKGQKQFKLEEIE